MIEIIPQTKASRPGWVNAILAVALVFLLIAVTGLLVFGMMSNNVRRDIEDASRRMEEINSPANKELEKTVLGYQTQFNNFSATLAKRYLASRVLGLLEETAHPGVLYQSLNIDIEKATIRAQAETSSYRILGEQLLIFNRDQRVKRVASKNYGRNKEGQITFDLELDFDPNIIQ